jgi:hypothetical protein
MSTPGKKDKGSSDKAGKALTSKDKESSELQESPEVPITQQALSIEELQKRTKVDLIQFTKHLQQTPQLSYADLARLHNISDRHAKNICIKLGVIRETTQAFIRNRADILAEGQRILLDKQFSPEELNKMSAKDRAFWFGIMADKEHRERSKGQGNHGFLAFFKGVQKQMKAGDVVIISPFPGPQDSDIQDTTPPQHVVPDDVIDITPDDKLLINKDNEE